MLHSVLNFLMVLLVVLTVKEIFRIMIENKKLSQKIGMQEKMLFKMYYASILYSLQKENGSIFEKNPFSKELEEFKKFLEKLKTGEIILDGWKINLNDNIAMQIKNWVENSIREVEEEKQCPVLFKNDLYLAVSTMTVILEELQQE